MSSQNDKSDPAKSQTRKLTEPQFSLLHSLIDDDFHVKYGRVFLQGEKEIRTATALQKRGLVAVHKSYHHGVEKHQYDVAITDAGYTALGLPVPSAALGSAPKSPERADAPLTLDEHIFLLTIDINGLAHSFYEYLSPQAQQMLKTLKARGFIGSEGVIYIVSDAARRALESGAKGGK